MEYDYLEMIYFILEMIILEMINYIDRSGEPCQLYPGLEHKLHQHPLGKFSSSSHPSLFIFVYISWRARVCRHNFAYVAHFVFLRDVWIRTQRAAVASRRIFEPGPGAGANQDPDWIRIQEGLLIRIQEGKMTHKNGKVEIF